MDSITLASDRYLLAANSAKEALYKVDIRNFKVESIMQHYRKST